MLVDTQAWGSFFCRSCWRFLRLLKCFPTKKQKNTTPEKSSIDTKNGHIWSRSHLFQGPSFWVGMIFTFSLKFASLKGKECLPTSLFRGYLKLRGGGGKGKSLKITTHLGFVWSSQYGSCNTLRVLVHLIPSCEYRWATKKKLLVVS